MLAACGSSGGTSSSSGSSGSASGSLKNGLKVFVIPKNLGILAAAQVVDSSRYKGKVVVTGLGTPNSMKKYVADGTVPAFELWNPADLGYLAAYAAVNFASKTITGAPGQSSGAGKLGKYAVGAGHAILLGPPFVFTKSNISKFNF